KWFVISRAAEAAFRHSPQCDLLDRGPPFPRLLNFFVNPSQPFSLQDYDRRCESRNRGARFAPIAGSPYGHSCKMSLTPRYLSPGTVWSDRLKGLPSAYRGIHGYRGNIANEKAQNFNRRRASAADGATDR